MSRWMERRGEAYVAHDAVVVGDVTLGRDVSIWFGAIVRADVMAVTIGAETNLQDQVIVHGDPGEPLAIGPRVTVGHAAILHGREIGEDCLIGIRATLLAGTVIGAESIVAAGALVTEGTVIPPRSLVMGIPGRVIRKVTDEEVALGADRIARYRELARGYLRGEVFPA